MVDGEMPGLFLLNAYPVATASGSDTAKRVGLFTLCAKSRMSMGV
jgi:hypothetical protein